MKNILYYLSLCLFLFSCKKDSKDEITLNLSASKKYAVTFTATSFSQEVAPISKSTGNRVSAIPLKGMAKYFIYVVYDASGREVSEIRQDSSGATHRIIDDKFYPDSDQVGARQKMPYGVFKDSLPKGDYTVVMIASNAEFSLNSRYNNFQELKFFPYKDAYFQYSRGLVESSRSEDTFYKKFKLTIDDKTIQQNIQLDRIVGKVELNILDSQVGAGSIYQVLIQNDGEIFRLATDQAAPGGSNDYETSTSGYSKYGIFGGKNSQYFVLNTVTPIQVVIIYHINGIKTVKTIDNVSIYKNRKTILTGSLFTDKTEVGFNTTVNDQFDQEYVEHSF